MDDRSQYLLDPGGGWIGSCPSDCYAYGSRRSNVGTVGDNQVGQMPRTLGDCTKMVEMLDARPSSPS